MKRSEYMKGKNRILFNKVIFYLQAPPKRRMSVGCRQL